MPGTHEGAELEDLEPDPESWIPRKFRRWEAPYVPPGATRGPPFVLEGRGEGPTDTHGPRTPGGPLDEPSEPVSAAIVGADGPSYPGSSSFRTDWSLSGLRQVLFPSVLHVLPESLYRLASAYRCEFLPNTCKQNLSDFKIVFDIFR